MLLATTVYAIDQYTAGWIFNGTATRNGVTPTGMQVQYTPNGLWYDPVSGTQDTSTGVDFVYPTVAGQSIGTNWRVASPVAGITQAASLQVPQSGTIS